MLINIRLITAVILFITGMNCNHYQNNNIKNLFDCMSLPDSNLIFTIDLFYENKKFQFGNPKGDFPASLMDSLEVTLSCLELTIQKKEQNISFTIIKQEESPSINFDKIIQNHNQKYQIPDSVLVLKYTYGSFHNYYEHN